MASDKQLIKQILKGRREAFCKLYRKYKTQINAICQTIVKNPHDAEELVQDTFVHAYLKVDVNGFLPIDYVIYSTRLKTTGISTSWFRK
jgi:hypothetical protein